MGKYREERKVTRKWWNFNCRHRITNKDKKILQFIYKHKLVTSQHIKDMFYRNNKTIRNCNRRLRILYDELYCIDRFFPPTKPGEGTNKQHIVLDIGGQYALDLDSFYKIDKLPYHYRHHKAVTDFHIQAALKGLGMGKLEHKMAGYKTDIYYSNYNMAVEIDTGCEVYKTLENKTKKYNRMTNLDYLLFITKGSENRIDFLLITLKIILRLLVVNLKI